ncbi:MAG: type II toxin-antitoxin system RelB/DinJ family antitoxin [Candidatus Deferrimicrobiota bacterium]
MARTAMIHARTEAGLKAETETILRSLGLSYTEAINLFLNQVRMRKGLPFAVEIPGSVSISVIERGRRRFILKKSLRVRVDVEGSVWVYEYSPLGILAYGSTQEEARDAFTTEFASLWEQVGTADDSHLTRDARSLKKRLLSLVDRVEGA